jgi:hypothetical protein
MTIVEPPAGALDPVASGAPLDEELVADPAERDRVDRAYVALVERLSRQSVEKNFDPYVDIDWDHPDMAIDAADPRWATVGEGFFGATDWFHTLSVEEQSRLGLERVATAMKLGLEFENVLKRGLLEYAFNLPNGSPEFRYLMHEVIEEANHSLMFQEFVNRSGVDAKGMGSLDKRSTRVVVRLATWFPELFFLFVLGGEDPIDHGQRKVLREGAAHPLLERIMRIHVTEEARHLSFARHHLKHRVPRLSRGRRLALSYLAPLLLGEMAKQMLLPPRSVVDRHGMPADAVAQVSASPEARQSVCDSLAKVRRLCVELGLVDRRTRRIWVRNGIWDEPAPG